MRTSLFLVRRRPNQLIQVSSVVGELIGLPPMLSRCLLSRSRVKCKRATCYDMATNIKCGDIMSGNLNFTWSSQYYWWWYWEANCCSFKWEIVWLEWYGSLYLLPYYRERRSIWWYINFIKWYDSKRKHFREFQQQVSNHNWDWIRLILLAGIPHAADMVSIINIVSIDCDVATSWLTMKCILIMT